MAKKIIFINLLMLIFAFFLGRMVGFYEIYLNRPPLHLAGEVNSGVALIKLNQGSCQSISGSVAGRDARIFYDDALVSVDRGSFQIDFR